MSEPSAKAARIELPPQLVAGIVRHLDEQPATVVMGPPERRELVPIKAASCYAFVSHDATVHELNLLLQQVLAVLAAKGAA